jgi:hypothetical protein
LSQKSSLFCHLSFFANFRRISVDDNSTKRGKDFIRPLSCFRPFCEKRRETEKNTFFSLLFYFLWLLKKLWNCQSLYPFISWTETLLHFGVGTIPIVVHRYCGVIQKRQTTITAYCRILYCRPLHRQPIIFLISAGNLISKTRYVVYGISIARESNGPASGWPDQFGKKNRTIWDRCCDFLNMFA